MLIRRSGRRLAASRPQSPKQPSTRHHGLGNDVKGNEGGPQVQGHGELRGLIRPKRNRWSYGRVFLHRVRSRTRFAARALVFRTPAGYLPRPRTTDAGA